MSRATRRAVETLIQEIEDKVNNIPDSVVEKDEIKASLVLAVGTHNQRRALEFALTDQGRVIDRDHKSYYENVHDSLGVEIGRKQLWDELVALGGRHG